VRKKKLTTQGKLFLLLLIKVNAFCCCIFLLQTAFISCSGDNENHQSGENARQEMGTVDNPKIDEASGIATSINNPGCFWTHNDSGDKARIFLIDSMGHCKAECTLVGATNRDWEDIATGPGPVDSLNYIYVGEIGDNFTMYPYKKIYRLIEPVITNESPMLVRQFDVITFKFPDRTWDAETLMVDPRTKDLYMVSKWEDSVLVYRIAYSQSLQDTVTVEKVISLGVTHITAGDISVDGSGILLKNYESVYFWNRLKHETVAQALSRKEQKLYYIEEPQGEGIAWARDGFSYYTLGEGFFFDKPKLYRYTKQ